MKVQQVEATFLEQKVVKMCGFRNPYDPACGLCTRFNISNIILKTFKAPLEVFEKYNSAKTSVTDNIFIQIFPDDGRRS